MANAAVPADAAEAAAAGDAKIVARMERSEIRERSHELR